MKRLFDPLLTLLGVIAVWALVVQVSGAPAYILPGPERVAAAFIEHPVLLLRNAGVTAMEALAGFALGVMVGAGVALWLVSSAGARRWLLPIVTASQAIPVFALAPLLTLWLGFGPGSKIVVTTLMIFFPVASAFYDGLRRVDPGLLDLATVMNASRGTALWRLRVPAALPSLGAGLKIAAVYAPIGAVLGEWVGASAGLGYLMLYANARLKIDLMFAAMILLAAMAITFHWAIARLARRLTHWAPESVA